jgi:hypothetical protein
MKFKTIFILSLAFIMSCSKDDSSSNSNSNITSSLTCKIDGAAFSASTISATNVSGSTLISGVNSSSGVKLIQFTITEGSKGEVNLGDGDLGQYGIGTDLFNTNVSQNAVGKVNITTNDLTSIQGSFSFDAVNNTGKIVKITDGKFVVKK